MDVDDSAESTAPARDAAPTAGTRRAPAGLRCGRCGYDLRWLTRADCPECGYPVASSIEESIKPPASPVGSAIVVALVAIAASIFLCIVIGASRDDMPGEYGSFIIISAFLFPNGIGAMFLFLHRFRIRIGGAVSTLVFLITTGVIVLTLLMPFLKGLG